MRNPFQSLIQSQVAAFQTQLVAALEELSHLELEGSSGGGAVKVLMTGGGEVRRVVIDPSVLDSADKELMEDLITAAMRDALAKVSETKREKIVASSPLAALGVDFPDIF
jgi:DNA-binding YbaB/EbfC family protein